MRKGGGYSARWLSEVRLVRSFGVYSEGSGGGH